MKFWKKKEKSKSTNPFEEDGDSNSVSTGYSQSPTAVSESVYKESAYKESAYKESAYKESAYKEPVYREPSYKESAYKEPVYREPSYKESSYKESAYKEPSYRESSYREPSYRESPHKKTSYKEPEFREPDNKEHYTAPKPMHNRDYSHDRQTLFSGYNDPTNRYDSSGNEDNYRTSKFNEGEEDQETVQIQRQIRNVKQESLASTRNALQKIGEAESAAANTMNMLGTQSSQIANVDRSLDLSKAYSDKASSQAGELKQLNRSIFIPVIKNPFNKGSRERKAMEKVNREHKEHMAERDNIRQFEYKSNARIEEAHRKVNRGDKEEFYNGRSQMDRNRYQFEPDEEDDAVEDEIDTNLNLLSDATSRLRTMATSMNDELDSQNKQLNNIGKKVDPINAKLMSTTHTLDSTR